MRFRSVVVAFAWSAAALTAPVVCAQRPTPRAAVPFEIHRNKLLIPVLLRGTALTMVFDTGSPPTVLTQPGRLDALGLSVVSRTRIGGAGGGERIPATITRGDVLRIGDAEVPISRFVALPLDTVFRQSSGRSYEGIIGGDLLRRFVVEFDFEAGVMRLYDPDTFGYDGPGNIVPIWIENGHPHTNARVVLAGGDERRVELVIDTGANHALSLADPVPAPPGAFPDLLGTGVSGVITGRVGRVALLTLGEGSLMIPGVITTFPDPGMGVSPGAEGNLGADFLRRFRVFFDYSRRRLILEPRPGPMEPFRWNASGLRFRAEGAGPRLVVRYVGAGSPGEAAGIMVGDEVLTVNGVAAATLGVAGTERVLAETLGEVGLRLDRNGTVVDRVVLRHEVGNPAGDTDGETGRRTPRRAG